MHLRRGTWIVGSGPRRPDCRDDPHREAPAGAGALPVVAIASRPDAATVRWMLAHRTASASAPALAVLVDDDPSLLLPSAVRVPTSVAGQDGNREVETAEETFARAGWTVVRVPTSATPVEAWFALAGDRVVPEVEVRRA